MQDRLIIGDTLNYATTVAGYPASDGWVLNYRLIPRSSGVAIDLIAATDPDNADGYVVQVAATYTSGWAAGLYSWSSWVTKDLEIYSLGRGECTLLPDPRTSTAPFDGRSQARIALEQAKAAMAAWTPTSKSYRIGEREMSFNSSSEIVAVIAYWQAEVTREERLEATAKGYPDRRKVYVRMANA